MQKVYLDQFDNSSWKRGRPIVVEFAWMILSFLFVSSPIPGSGHRRWLLRFFGAKIGSAVVIKPSVKIKFPWRLSVGNHTWIGEGVWIDNLNDVRIGSNACISQDAFLCTGSHDWASSRFSLITEPISIGDGAWVSARSVVGPGVTVGEGAVLSLGSIATKDLAPWGIYFGNPVKKVKLRKIKDEDVVKY